VRVLFEGFTTFANASLAGSLAGIEDDGRRSRAFARLALNRQGEAGSSDQQVNSSSANGGRKITALTKGQHIGRKGFRLGCACR